MASSSTDADHVAAWFRHVNWDMASINNNLYGPTPIVTSAAYHCQQAAEKLVKALLVSLDIVPPKIHDIEVLLRLVPSDNPHLPMLRPLARFTYLGFAYRYPDPGPFSLDYEVPTIDEVAGWLAELTDVEAKLRAALLPPPA